MNLEQQIEGVLFYKTEPVSVTSLASFFEVSEVVILETVQSLATRLESGGTRVVQTEKEVQLLSAPELGPLIDTLRKEELSRSIGKAGAETLAIILYRGPISRVEIDKIRGVNSSFIIRNLLIRGLVEKIAQKKNMLGFSYAATPLLLSHLGVTKKNELPQYEDIMNALDTFETTQEETAVETS